ncbi:MAG: short-chain dehydrogenase/reductase [Gammaproteobacteria bacterium]|jgi:citronellol/citronellal dehydrogenase|nr:short-chain dehydrogenase/reductase [Gammaproteobacteria bacterium]
MLQNKTIFITGASRGIGREIALRCAKDGANIVIAAKSDTPHPKLAGTIYTVAEEIEKLGGKALALKLDVRDEDNIQDVVKAAVKHFGGIDILVNNASAISLTDTAQTSMRRFDLMMGVNTRGTFACSQACLPHLAQAENPHILTLSPPLNLNPKWFAPHLAYTMSKYGMSMCTLGMAEEFKPHGIAVNSLWPKTVIATAAIEFNFPPELMQAARKPAIMADAAYAILTSNSRDVTGNFFIDEEVLRQKGVEDFDQYAINPGAPLFQDLFLDK